MTWFKVDDQFPDHPKMLRAGPEAGWLYICGGCYCARHLTDGIIPKEALPMLSALKGAAQARAAVKLVEVGAWYDRGDNYEMHGYLEYNPSREQVETERRKAAERRARGGQTSGERRANVARETGAPVPSRPDVLTERVYGAPNGASRAQRIPDEFLVSDEMVEWVERECPSVNWQWQTEKFVDWAKSASGRNSVKKDWVRAWRNWMRSEQEKTRT